MNSLYVVGAPAGDPADLTRRAVRILREVSLVVADDVDGRQPMGQTQRLLAHHGIMTPLATAAGEVPLTALDKGDVAYLCPGWLLGLPDSGCQLIRAAIERGHAVVPIPGPVLPITALVVSGLPADSFVYLGELPRHDPARHDLLACVAGQGRTLILLEQPDCLVPLLGDLRVTLGDRPAVIVAAREEGPRTTRAAFVSGVESLPEPGTGVMWRGSLCQAPEVWSDMLDFLSPLVLIVGGARGQEIGPSSTKARWDETRLRSEIRACLEQGLGTREIGRLLATDSGWPRREIYRLAVEESAAHEEVSK